MPDGFPQPPVLTPPSGSGTPPSFPAAWQATALLTPYRNSQLYAADIRYDWSLQAMRALLCGVEEGAIDLLYIGSEFYIILPSDGPDLRYLGPYPSNVPVPPPNWLAGRNMALQGRGELMGVSCDWWVGYSPNANGYEGPPPTNPADIPQVCNWVWVRSDSGLPFRLFFTNADNPYALPAIGDFSMTNFTRFEAESPPGLADEVAAARSRAEQPSPEDLAIVAAAQDLDGLRAALARRHPSLTATPGRAGDLIPGLGPAPAGAPVPAWTPRMCLTGYTYPTAKSAKVSAGALPMRVFYDEPKGRMLTRASLEVSQFDGAPVEDMILNTSMTYLVARMPDGSHVCAGTKPVGLPKLDWGKQDGGLPKAVIRDNPVLGPGEVIHVTTLPSQGGRWFWTWYTEEGDGRLFMETPQFGDVGLVVTDYYLFDHAPPAFPDEAFVVPPDCLVPPATPSPVGRR